MKVLVTGATGFVGGHVVDACLAAGYETRALVRPGTPAGRLAALGVEVLPGDVTDPASLARATAGVDAVFHLAALYALWAPDPAAFERTNVEGTRNVLRACARAGARAVYCSTVAAVGGTPDPAQAADEDWTFNLAPTGDPYILTKRRAEEEVLRMHAAGEVEVVVVNPAAPVGPRDARPTPTGDLLVKFLNGLVRFWVDGGFNVVDVRDVARGHLLALDKGRSGQRYILGAENLTVRELLGRTAALTGLPGPRFRLPHPLALAGARAAEGLASLLRRPPPVTAATARASRFYLFASCGKARRELGFEPGPVDAAIADAARWFARSGYLRPSRARRVLQHLGD